jgi:hypothetical protein
MRSENALEHVPEKLTDFSDKNMPSLFDLVSFLLDRMIPSDRKTLWHERLAARQTPSDPKLKPNNTFIVREGNRSPIPFPQCSPHCIKIETI